MSSRHVFLKWGSMFINFISRFYIFKESKNKIMKFNLSIFLLLIFIINVSAQKKFSNKFIKEKKILAQKLTQENHKKTQIMVDKVFSFAEHGFHEVESSK